MKHTYSKKILSILLAGAMVITGATGLGADKTASAAAKKATIKFAKSSYTVKVGKTLSLKGKIVKKNVKKVKSMKWSSKSTKIAKVNKKGVVTGVAEGSTTISCKVKYLAKGAKKYKTKTIKTKVKVTEADLKVKWNDKSNIGAERTVSIVGGTSDSMKVKDNGSVRKELSSQYLIKNEMGLGINLGNTMEATKALGEIDNFTEATDFEQAWSAPITTQKYIDCIHSYGINTLRIPVAWTSMVSKDGKYTINPKMLGRVEEIVNYALNNGMYVIINDHYDYGWWGAFGSADPVIREGAWKRYESYWTQICERFKGYSDHLIFESANEELNTDGPGGGGLNAPINADGYHDEDNGVKGILTPDEVYETANKINQKFVDIVRASGGNNEYRHLLIAGNATDINKTCNSKFVMPTDTIASNGKDKLMVSVHYYDPWSYCGDGMNGAAYTAKDKEHTETQFAKMKKFTDQGYGVIVGECGVCNPLQDGVISWLKDTFRIATKYGCVPVLWDTPGTYFDREACIMQFKDVAQMYNSITGAKGNTNISTNTGFVPKDVNYYSSIPSTAKKVFSWEGAWKKNDGSNVGLDGSVITSSGMEQFIRTDSVSNESQITFNDWGYQTFLKLDWKSLKNPVIQCTFETDTADVVGDLQMATCKKPNGAVKGTVTLPYEEWGGKSVSISAAILKNLQTNAYGEYMSLTFGNAPMVKSITIYDLGK